MQGLVAAWEGGSARPWNLEPSQLPQLVLGAFKARGHLVGGGVAGDPLLWGFLHS